MKTLANCTFSEFMQQAYKAREAFHALYFAIGAERMHDEFLKQAADAAKDERGEIARRYVEKLFWAIMAAEPEKTLAVVAAAAFLTPAEADRLKPIEGLTVLTDCLASEDVMAFFINAERLGGSDTEGILRTLTLLLLASSGGDTSQTASQSSTSSDAEPTQSPATSESVSAD